MDVLTALSSSALFAGEALRLLVICRMVSICLDHGNSDGAPLAYVLLGSIRGMFFNDYQGGLRLAKVGLELVERPGLERFRARVYLGFGVHIANWTQPVDVARSYFQRAFNAAQESGDVSFAAFSCVDTITNLLASGASLTDVEREAERQREIAKELRFDAIRRSIAQQLAVVRILQGQVSTEVPFGEAALAADHHEKLGSGEGADDEAPEKGHRSLYAIGAIRELQARTFMQDYAAGLAAVERDPPLWTVPTQFERADYQFFEGICHAALSDTCPDSERAHHIEVLTAHHRQMLRWAESCPSTFESRAALLGAEIARLEARELDAERAYELAIRSAREQGLVQIEALAYECAARFYAKRDFDQIALLYLQNARRCYSIWGADGKVEQLEALHPSLKRDDRSAGSRDTIGAPVEHLDLATVIKVSQAVSGELILDRLLDTLMRTAIEQAGAARGLLIVGGGSDQKITVEATVTPAGVVVELHDDLPTDAALPMSILQYVLRTQDVVVLDDASSQDSFASDVYIRENKPRSVLCLPLLNQKRLLGAIYLENNLAPGVFAPARVPVLKLLASQAAISLENTRLYLDLAEREAKIRRLVDANIIGIFFWTSDGRIVEANDAFLRIIDYRQEDVGAGRVLWTELAPEIWNRDDPTSMQERPATGFVEPFEKEFFRKDGSRVPVIIGATAFQEGGNQGVAFVLDLTERKRAEAEARESERRYREVQTQLAHANRVATMGQLTASIAHDVSQPIAAVLANAQAALRWLARQPPDLVEVEQAVSGILKSGTRASDVVYRMRALFKQAPESWESLSVNEALREIIVLTRGETVKGGVAVRTQLAEDLPQVRGDRVQLQQVMLNLILNAIEAMNEIDAGDRILNIATEWDEPRGAILVSVSDTGPGLGPDSIKQVFEAFYTTKPAGMGMGLSICSSIVEAHGGMIWASANTPSGAIFSFTLPPNDQS